MRRLLMLAPLALLAACSVSTNTSEPGANDKIYSGEVALVAEAPDGTKLWGVEPRRGGRVVYFASAGTARTVGCGKNCTRLETVPTGDPLGGAR